MVLPICGTPDVEPESPKPAHRLFVNRDILGLLSDEINNQAVLYNLCLVNKLFNAFFSKGLYERLLIDISPERHPRRKRGFSHVIDSGKAFNRVIEKGYLKHTKSIVVVSTLLQSKPLLYWEGWHTFANLVVHDVLKHTPNLISYGSSDFDPSGEVLMELANLPKLRNLSLSFSELTHALYYYKFEDIAPDIFQLASKEFSFDMQGTIHRDVAWYLPKFRNLRKLSLFEVGTEGASIPIWGACLLQVLLRNRGLRVLRLSKNANLMPQSSRTRSPWADMFRTVCNLYETTVGQALQLDEISLDTVFHPPWSPFPNVVQTAVPAPEPPSQYGVHVEFPPGQAHMISWEDGTPVHDPYRMMGLLAESQERKVHLTLRSTSPRAIELKRIPDYPRVTEAMVYFRSRAGSSMWTPNPLPVFRRILAKFVNAEALWYTQIENWFQPRPKKRQLRKMAVWLFKNLKNLKYLRLETMAWLCQRDGDKVKLIPLEPLEDQLECPDQFIVPFWPRTYTGMYHHDL